MSTPHHAFLGLDAFRLWLGECAVELEQVSAGGGSTTGYQENNDYEKPESYGVTVPWGYPLKTECRVLFQATSHLAVHSAARFSQPTVIFSNVIKGPLYFLHGRPPNERNIPLS